MEVIKEGTMIGRKKVLRVYKVGAFTFVDTECQCAHKTIIKAGLLHTLISGRAVSCRTCYLDDKRAAIATFYANRRLEANEIRKRFKNT